MHQCRRIRRINSCQSLIAVELLEHRHLLNSKNVFAGVQLVDDSVPTLAVEQSNDREAEFEFEDDSQTTPEAAPRESPQIEPGDSWWSSLNDHRENESQSGESLNGASYVEQEVQSDDEHDMLPVIAPTRADTTGPSGSLGAVTQPVVASNEAEIDDNHGRTSGPAPTSVSSSVPSNGSVPNPTDSVPLNGLLGAVSSVPANGDDAAQDRSHTGTIRNSPSVRRGAIPAVGLSDQREDALEEAEIRRQPIVPLTSFRVSNAESSVTAAELPPKGAVPVRSEVPRDLESNSRSDLASTTTGAESGVASAPENAPIAEGESLGHPLESAAISGESVVKSSEETRLRSWLNTNAPELLDRVAVAPPEVRVAAIVDAVLSTTPVLADLLTDVLPIDVAAVQASMDSALERVELLGRTVGEALIESATDARVSAYAVTLAAAAAGGELIRRRGRRAMRGVATVITRDGAQSTWLPDSAGAYPEGK